MGRAFKKYGWNRNDIVVSTKVSWSTNKLPDINSNSVSSTGEVLMARCSSITTACHANTWSKALSRPLSVSIWTMLISFTRTGQIA
jgi:hypothetical protein